MWLRSSVLDTLALYLLCTTFTTASRNLKGDPELSASFNSKLVQKNNLYNDVDLEDINGLDLGPDPLDELDKHVEKMVKHLDVSV